jgi:hypothetical protein
MKNTNYNSKGTFSLFSIISSFDVYHADRDRFSSRLMLFGKEAIRLSHARNGRPFYTRPLPGEHQVNFDKEKWVKLIKANPNIENYLWPIDIVELGKNRYALLFPLRDDLGGYESMECMLSNLAFDAHSWNCGSSVVLCKNLIEAWCRLEDSGYLYHEFSFDNMFCNMDNDVMFNFSFSTHKGEAKVLLNRIHPDYIDVYYYQMKTPKMDKISNYFSMAVILFRLLIGILPYQGRLLEGVHNITKSDHKEWIKKYHQNTIFIFDKDEQVNRISSTSNPEMYEQRWERLSPLARGMFHSVFTTDNALRKNTPKFYTPHDWKNILL